MTQCLDASQVPGAAASAGRLMWVYLLSRMLYPLAFYVGHPLLQLATQPGYLIVFGQLLDLAASASTPSPWWSAMRCEQGIYGLILISCCVFLYYVGAALGSSAWAPDAHRGVHTCKQLIRMHRDHASNGPWSCSFS